MHIRLHRDNTLGREDEDIVVACSARIQYWRGEEHISGKEGAYIGELAISTHESRMMRITEWNTITATNMCERRPTTRGKTWVG